MGTVDGASGESPVGSDAYLYRGERYDALTGLYHLRSRDYDPALGRFHQIDDFAGFPENRYSLNRYNYAESNPVGKFDPAGRFAVTSLVTAVYALHINDQYLAELASAGPQFTFDPDEALNRYLMTDHLVSVGAPLKLKERELWVRTSGGGMIGSWVNESGSSQATEERAGRGFGAGSDVFFLHQSGARFRQGWALRQVEQAWGALQQSRLSLNLGPRFPDDPRSKRIAEGNVRLKGTRWADAIYADALLQATLRSATNEGRRGVRAHYTPTVEGRRYDATGVDLTARATTALNAASGGGPVDWESDLPAGSNRFLVAPDMGALESPVVGEFARAMEEVTRSDAYQAAYLWAQVGVSLPGEAGLMTASMIPGVGEGMDAHVLATSESRMERWIAGTSLGLSGITLGVAPNFGRFARFIGDMANAGTRRGVQTMSRVAGAISDGSARIVREASTAGTALRRTGRELTADARVFGRAYWQSAHVLGVVPQDPLLAGVRAVQSRRALGFVADEVTGLGNVLGTTSNAPNRLIAAENAASFLPWEIGDSITKALPDGNYPKWFSSAAADKAATVQGRYWMNRAAASAPGEFTTRQLAQMRSGFAPQAKVVVRKMANGVPGPESVQTISKELHHNLRNRGVPGFDEPLHLREVWPWQHELIDQFRHTGYEFVRFAD